MPLQIGITVISLVTTAALIGILIWQELRDDENGQKLKDNRGDEELTEETISSLFPGFFRTPEQQEQVFERYIDSFYFNRTNVTERHIPNNLCYFGCEFSEFRKRKRQASNYILHGCCKSWVKVEEAPATMEGIDGSFRTVLQFKKSKQYLINHYCSQEAGCTGCTCSKERVLFSAVVHKKKVTRPKLVKHVEVSLFLVEGACRCVNR